ncbi:unnamed protein product [Linum trigynum]|uniref:DUF538 domain-containing protein n=1 Tax=Linum trigynum TaxID=586398 RepID=A0AAV2FHF8_9ROSI
MSTPLPSTMASIIIFSVSLLLILSLSPAAAGSGMSASLQKLLHSQGLPGGLFPDNVKSFDLDSTGRLEVELDGPCLAKFENRVFFESVLRANLSFGGLIGMEGLTQEELFLWFPVKGIFVSDPASGVILLDIGLARKQLSVSLFEDPPSCKAQQGELLKESTAMVGLAAER